MAQTLDAILPMELIEGEWVTMTSLLSKNKVVLEYAHTTCFFHKIPFIREFKNVIL